MTAKTLVTGFEPFGGAKSNPSELIVRMLAASAEPGLVTAVLPTSYRRAESALSDLFHTHKPDTVLMLGLRRRASGLCLEQIAENMDTALAPDNDGDIRVRRCIVENAPASYPSTLPLEPMATIAGEEGEVVTFSNDAGGYVCNHVFYHAAHLVATVYPVCSSGFIHVPPMEGSSERMMRVVTIVLRWIALINDQPLAGN